MVEGVFDTINNKFWPQHSETIKPLLYCKISRKSSENAEELKGRFRISAAEYNYKEIDRQVKEQFIHGLNDSNMLIEIIHELIAIKDTRIVTDKQMLAWAR